MATKKEEEKVKKNNTPKKEVKKTDTPKKETTKKSTVKKESTKKTTPKKVTPKKEVVIEKVEEKIEEKPKESTITKADLEKTTIYTTQELNEEEKKQEEKKAKALAKKERRKEFMKEVRAFFILLLSIGLICLGVWYWYTHYYNNHESTVRYEKEEKQIAEYKTVRYTLNNENDYLEMLNNKYLVERNKDTVYKIMDLKSDALFDGEESFEYIYEGTDNNIYAYNVEGTDFENVIDLYILKDKEFEKAKTVTSTGVLYNAIFYEDENDNKYLAGFQGVFTGYNEDLKTVSETRIHTISGKDYKVSDYYFVGDNESIDELRDIITYDKKYVIMYEIKDGKKNYGLYDIEDEKVIIKPQYEGLYTSGTNYIAIKKGKAGIVTSKLKIIVDFTYDFIDRHSNFYVVAKNNKLAIMNEDYKLVTDFIYDYQPSNDEIEYTYNLGDNEINTFTANYINNKYVLSINNGEDKGYTYDKHETYIINTNGTYSTIATNKYYISDHNSLIYSYDTDKKTYTLYDQYLDKLYTIDLSEYDYNTYPKIELVNENTLIIHINSDIYFNYETGEEISKPQNYQTVINGVTISYSNKTNKVEYQVNNKIVATIPVDISEDNVYFNKLNDNILYYNTKKDYVYIEKGE